MINIAVLGYGTVGSGVVEVLDRNRTQISRRTGEEISVKYILDLRDFPGDPYENRVVHDFNIILKDEQVSIICEVMGGTGAAYQFTKQALEAGRSVCTSNKELVAKHGAELSAIAERMHCNYMFEASVGGGIPIIRTLTDALTADRVESVTGILNGTTNYILTKMEKEGADYAQALARAQELGYAERNPEADVEGRDAGRKIAILTSLLTGRYADPDKIPTEGITGITKLDFAFAKAADMTIKLLAECRIGEDGSVQAMVAPFMLDGNHPLAAVNDVFNGIRVTGNMLGEALFCGQGAGKLPTASAVAADVAACAKNPGRTVASGWKPEEVRLKDMGGTQRRFFVRASKAGRETLEEAFAGGRSLTVSEIGDEFGFITPMIKEEDFWAGRRALGDIVLNVLRLG